MHEPFIEKNTMNARRQTFCSLCLSPIWTHISSNVNSLSSSYRCRRCRKQMEAKLICTKCNSSLICNKCELLMVLILGDQKEQRIGNCEVHKEPLEFFCVVCVLPVCVVSPCAGKHHIVRIEAQTAVRKLREEFDNYKEYLYVLTQKLKYGIKKVQGFLTKVKTMSETIILPKSVMSMIKGCRESCKNILQVMRQLNQQMVVFQKQNMPVEVTVKGIKSAKEWCSEIGQFISKTRLAMNQTFRLAEYSLETIQNNTNQYRTNDEEETESVLEVKVYEASVNKLVENQEFVCIFQAYVDIEDEPYNIYETE